MAGTLFVLATPLGNLEDASPRLARTLREVDVVFAEDTRRTQKLCAHFGVRARLESLHGHNERERSARVVTLLEQGRNVAYATDAGTPAVSDPGALLVAAVAQAGLAVVPVVGPSALAGALSVAGFAQEEPDVLFLGFLAPKGPARKRRLEQAQQHTGLVVLYEAPQRLARLLDDIHQDERRVCVVRELTKLHEEIWRGTVAEARLWAQGEVRGELTVVLGPNPVRPAEADEARDAVIRALQKCFAAGLSARDSASAVAALLERPRREVYSLALELAHRL